MGLAATVRRLGSRGGGPLLAASAVLATLLAAELGLRVHAGWRQEGRLDTNRPPPPPGGRAALGEILIPSRERRIVYELRPQLDVSFEGARLTTDAQGFRRTPGGAAGDFRIVGIGDSYMFGWGVADEQTYLARLQSRLRERFGTRSWDVVNTAVPGYNTVMEVATLEHKGLALAPRIVVLEIVSNDLDLPNFLQAPPPTWSLQRSFLLDFVARRMRHSRPVPPSRNGDDGLVAAPEVRDEANRHFEGNPSRVPPEYRELVGREAFERSLRALARLRDEHGFRVVVLSQDPSFDWLQHFSRRRSRELGLPYLDVGRAVWRRVSQEGFVDYQDSPYALGPTDPHPSALGHDLTSEVLFRFLVEQGWVAD